MGSCASRPKEFDDKHPEPLPREASVSPTDPETESEAEVKAEAAAEESKEKDKDTGGEKPNEAPLSEPKQGKQEDGYATSDKQKPPAVDPASAVSASLTTLHTPENKIETAGAAPVITKEEVKEKKNETKIEDKSDAPLGSL